jgi:hypothetical protein
MNEDVRYTVETDRGYVVCREQDYIAALSKAASEAVRVGTPMLVVTYRRGLVGSWVADNAVEVNATIKRPNYPY